MSSVALTSGSSSLAPTARPKDPLAKLLPGPLTTYREFPQNDELALFTEIYEANVGPAAQGGHQPDDEGGGRHRRCSRRARSATVQELGGECWRLRVCRAASRCAKFAPGLYVLRVEAQSRVGDRPRCSRETSSSASSAAPSGDACAGHSGPGASGCHPAGARAPRPPRPQRLRTRTAGRSGGAGASPSAGTAGDPVPMTPLNSDLHERHRRAQQTVVAHRRGMARRSGRRMRPGGPRPPWTSTSTWSSRCS